MLVLMADHSASQEGAGTDAVIAAVESTAHTFDPRTFEQAFDSAFRAAYRVAYRLLGNRDDADECAQEALARAYPRWKHLSRNGNPTPWVVRVAANLAIDHWRRSNRQREASQSTSATSVASADAGLADRLAIHSALAVLPRRQRQVVVLRYLADMTESQVAAALTINIGTVKQHASRGLTALRIQLGNELQEQ